MNIGLDAKRAFLNRSGLGNYSRFVIQSLVKFQDENNYFLFTPEKNNLFEIGKNENIKVILPRRLSHRMFPSYWRTFGVSSIIKKNKIDIYHGLSGEIPHSLTDKGVKTVVSIHDLIFLRYPEFYKAIDRKIYTSKFRHACKDSDKIIAISEQTKSDIMDFFGVSDKKIDVIYQACNERFHSLATSNERIALKEKYELPENYLLYVGTIEKRKNLLSLLQAIHIGKIDMPLVIVGKPTSYLKIVQDYIHNNSIENIYFLLGVPNEDLPGIYQMSTLFVYPSVFEGFGIPILEALYSKTPVITSVGSCFSEAGGKYSIYIDPCNPEEMANAITRVLSDNNLHTTMVEEGYRHALSFDPSAIASQLMNTYNLLMNE